MSPIFVFIVGSLVLVLAGAFVLDLRRRKYRGDDASIDQHQLKRPPREGSQFRQGGPGGVTGPSDPGLGVM